MAITPLDLQTVFVRLNEVSKQQSHSQHASALQQELEARKLVEQELQKNSTVPGTQEDQESGKVEEEEDRNQGGDKKQGSPRETRENPKKEIVKDPEMGKHIDISG